MERDLYNGLLEWKVSGRRKPLVIQGARQVGKTYLIKEFGKREYSDVAYFNFDEDPALGSLFKARLEPGRLIEKLSAYRGKKIDSTDTLVIFDEIQESPDALNSLKYFCEDANQYHIATAGSLLGIKLAEASPFPVGKVNFLHLYPMTFFEFLDATGKSGLRDLIEAQKTFTSLDDAFHNELMDIMRTYYYVGGFPEAVSGYVETRDFNAVRVIQKEVLKAYALDFSKHAQGSDAIKVTKIWESIPVQLARENRKFTFSTLGKNARAREHENALQWLVDAGLVYKVSNVSRPGIPLEGYAEKHVFKIYTLDVGILGAMTDLTPKTILDGNELFTHYKGAFVENYVAQELVAKHGKNLYYWTSPGTAEVDFVFQRNEDILPLEVKAGEKRRSRSLMEYGKRYKPLLLSYASPMNFSRNGDVCNYPLYGACLFPALE